MTRRFRASSRGRRPSLAVQAAALKNGFPDSECSVKNGTLRWSMEGFRGSPVTDAYGVELVKKCGRPLEVWLSGGALERRDSLEDVPHHYRVDAAKRRVMVCLELGDYHDGQLYVDTYVPWAMEWIVHFEIWSATGVWNGGGLHPGDDSIPIRNRRCRRRARRREGRAGK